MYSFLILVSTLRLMLPVGDSIPPAPLAEPTTPLSTKALYPTPRSLVSLTDNQLQNRLETDLTNLGSMSIGLVNGGALLNGIQMEESPFWDVVNPKETWGTFETISFVDQAITTVNRLYPETPPLYIGDISDPDGGRLNLHTTHQSGRDVDLGFYYKGGKGTWFVLPTGISFTGSCSMKSFSNIPGWIGTRPFSLMSTG